MITFLILWCCLRSAALADRYMEELELKKGGNRPCTL